MKAQKLNAMLVLTAAFCGAHVLLPPAPSFAQSVQERTTLTNIHIEHAPLSSGTQQQSLLTQPSDAPSPELVKKALSLVDGAAGDAASLRVAENSALIQATAADLIWTHDEKRARALFTDAFSNFNVANLNNKAATTANSRRDFQQQNLRWMRVRLRGQILQLIARHDAKLALDLLRAAPQPQPASNSSEGIDRTFADEDLRLEQSLAMQVAATDPQQALRIAEESLAHGVTQNLNQTVRMLQAKDSEAALKLATDIIAQLSTMDFKDHPEAGLVGVDLLRFGTQPEQKSPLGNSSTTAVTDASATKKTAAPPLLSETAARDLAQTLAKAFLNGANGFNDVMFQSATMMPLFEKYAPERVAQLRRRADNIIELLDPTEQALIRFQSQMQSNDPEALIVTAKQAPPEIRAEFYDRAAMLALNKGDATRARQIVEDNVPESDARTQLLALIDRQTLQRAIAAGKFDEAKQILEHNKTNASPKERAMMLAQLAQMVAASKTGDRKLALELMDEARSLVGGAPPEDEEQLGAQLALAAAYASIEPSRSFEIIEPIIEQANKLLRAAALLSKFGGGNGQLLFKDGEFVLSAGPISSMRFQYGRALTRLARADFDRAKADAERFQQPELRLMARLLVAQGVLVNPQNSPQTDNYGSEFMMGGAGVLIGR